MTKICMNLSHGKATKQYLFDMISNQPITEKEWNRYEVVHKVEKSHLPTKNHIKRKVEELEKIRNHIFTEVELSDMIAKKKELSMTGNSALERLRLEHALAAARDAGDAEKVETLEKQIEDIDAVSGPIKNTGSKLDLLAKLNARNREADLEEGRMRELEALALRRKQKVNESDPFARRKTQPVHIISGFSDKEVEPEESDALKSASISAGVISVEAELSNDDDLFDDIDISVLEQGFCVLIRPFEPRDDHVSDVAFQFNKMAELVESVYQQNHISFGVDLLSGTMGG